VDSSQYAEYRPLMFSIAYRMTGSVTDAEDIVQEAFLRAASGGGVESPKAYLATITTRLARPPALGPCPPRVLRRDLAPRAAHRPGLGDGAGRGRPG